MGATVLRSVLCQVAEEEVEVRERTVAGLSAILTMWAAGKVGAQEHWGQFRGPGGRGIAAGRHALPVEFDASPQQQICQGSPRNTVHDWS